MKWAQTADLFLPMWEIFVNQDFSLTGCSRQSVIRIKKCLNQWIHGEMFKHLPALRIVDIRHQGQVFSHSNDICAGKHVIQMCQKIVTYSLTLWPRTRHKP